MDGKFYIHGKPDGRPSQQLAGPLVYQPALHDKLCVLSFFDNFLPLNPAEISPTKMLHFKVA